MNKMAAVLLTEVVTLWKAMHSKEFGHNCMRCLLSLSL